MVEEVRGIVTGGGGSGVPPHRGRLRPPAASVQEIQAKPEREGDSAFLSFSFPSPAGGGVQALLERLETLQKALVSLPPAAEEETRRNVRARLAEAEVALSNLLGASAAPSPESLSRNLHAPGPLSADRVLQLLGVGGGRP